MKEEMFKTNSYYEGLIQNFFGGAKGCFSAFMHLFYQYNQSLIYFEQYSQCFSQLYAKELENCSILSEIILRMGGDNKYYSSSRKFLSGYNIDYVKNFSQIFLLDIELLETNVIELKSMIAKIDNNGIKNKLKTILDNKKYSLKLLKENYFKTNLIETKNN